jgi:hypothetical protein
MRLNHVHQDQVALGTRQSELEEAVGTSTARRWAFSLTSLSLLCYRAHARS